MNFLDRLLEYYEITYNDYLILKEEASLASVPNYRVFKNIDKAKALILEAIKNKEKVLVYGDYDADGILATSIIVKMFNKLNYPISYYIPSRYLDGYGISAEKIIKAKEKGYQLIITVDNGIKAIDAINKAKELGIKLLITDHHEYTNVPSDLIYLHPKESTLKVTTSGAMVAFYLSYAVLNEINPYLLVLGATSILSDMMPLINENRHIVKLGLRYLNKYQYRTFTLLSNQINYDANVLALHVIPKINAVGRVETKKEVNLLVKYFTSEAYLDLVNIREFINITNEKRKTLSLDIINKLTINSKTSIVENLDILSGLTGLIANRLLTEYNLPTCIFSSEEINGCIRGSIRTKFGFNAMDFINECPSLFIEQGGHEYAAGIVIKKEDFASFKEAFNKYALSHPFKKDNRGIEITLDEINTNNYQILMDFAPFGTNHKEPNFIIKDVNTSMIKKNGKHQEHLKMVLPNGSQIIGFNYPFNEIKDHKIEIVGQMKLGEFNHKNYVEFIIKN